jgi:hypothetical protein
MRCQNRLPGYFANRWVPYEDEKGPEKALEKDLEIERGHGFGIGR